MATLRKSIFAVVFAFSSSVRAAEPSSRPVEKVTVVPGYKITEPSLTEFHRNVTVARKSKSEGVEGVNQSGLRVGIPASILDYAKAHVVSTRVSNDLDALDSHYDALRICKFGSLDQKVTFLASWAQVIDKPGFQTSSIVRDELRFGENVVAATGRPALFICNRAISDDVPAMWFEAMNNPKFSPSLSNVCASVGLISYSWRKLPVPVGTGFVVAKNLVMTNRHVAETFADSDNSFRRDPFNPSIQAEVTIDFCGEKCLAPRQVWKVKRIVYLASHSASDVAVLELETQNGVEPPPPLDLQLSDPADSALRHVGSLVYIAGYPFNDERTPGPVEYKVFGSPLGVKRLLPGQLQKESGLGNFGFLVHDCSTLGGCSGSPLINLESGKVWGIHFAGVYRQANYAYPMWTIANEAALSKLLGSKP